MATGGLTLGVIVALPSVELASASKPPSSSSGNSDTASSLVSRASCA